MEEINRRVEDERRKLNLGHTPERRSGEDRRLREIYEKQFETAVREMAAQTKGPELSENALSVLASGAKEKFKVASTIYENTMLEVDQETDTEKAKAMRKKAQDDLDEAARQIKEKIKTDLQLS